MLNKSIAYRLSIYISVAVISVFMAFILISFAFDRELLKENVENKAIGIGMNVMMTAEKSLVATREIASNISEQIIYYGENNEIELLISKLMEKYKFLNAIHVNIDSSVPNLAFHNYFIIRIQDSMLYEQGNSNIYDSPYEKEILSQVTSTGKPGWARPFRCPINNIVIVSYYYPIKIINETNDTLIVGEVIAELSLNDLNNTISSMAIGNRGSAFMIAKNGDYITHPNEEWVLNRNIYKLSEKIFDKKKINVKKIINLQQTGSTIAYPESANYEKSWVYYTPVKETGWSFVVIFPYSELFEPLYKTLLKMLFFSVLGILIIFAIITYLSSKLMEPLNTVTAQLKRFSNISGGADIKTMNEVEQVSESLKYLKKWYEKYKVNQRQEKKNSFLHMQDLIQASEIQQSLIKTDFSNISEIPEIDIFAIYKPARIVSGDLFDYFFLDDKHIILTMGDVSGKGIPAALFMSVAQTIIKTNSLIISPNEIVAKVNNELFTTNQHQFFLTLFLGVLNIETGVLKFCNAAHTATYILKLSGEIVELSKSHGLPLGLYPNKDYSSSKITLEEGDTIIMYSDGITELQNENAIQFGNERFIENIQFLAGSNPENLTTRIERSLDTYRGEAKQIDDITLMAIKYKA